MDAGFCAVDNDFDHFLSKSHEITSGFVNSYDYCNPREVPHITRNGRPAYNSRNMSETFHTPNFGDDFEILPITPPTMPGEGRTPGMNPASAVGYPEHTTGGSTGGSGGGGGEPTFHTAGSPQQMSSLTSPLNPQQATNVPSPRTSTNSPVLSQAQSPALSHTMSPAGTYTTSLSNVTPSYSSQSSPVFSEQLSHMTESLPAASSAQAPINPQFPPQMFDVPPITDAAINMGHFGSGMDPTAMGASLGSAMSGANTHMSPSYHMSHPQQAQHHPHPQQQQAHHPHHPQQAHHPQDSSNFFHHGHTEMGPPHPPGPQHLSTINHSQLGLGMHHGGLPPMSQQHHAQLMAGQTGSPPHMVAGRAGHLESSEDSDDNTPLAQFAAQAKRPEVVKETKKKPPKRKRKKDPNEPQKPVSAYALFFRDTQAAIKGQNPNASFGEVSKIVASMWDSLDAEQKAAYKQRTETAKKEYLKKLAAYRASLVSKAAVDQIDPEDQSPSKQQRLSGPVSVSPPHGANVAGSVGQLHPSVAPRVIAPKPSSSSNAPVGGTMTTSASPYGQPAAMVQPMQNMQRVVKPMSPPMVVSEPQQQLCTRNGCKQLPIQSPDWDNEYCSSQCVVDHCRDVFTGWVATNSVNSGMVPHTVK